ncbi:MAG TPA: hypothetical protein DEF51_44355, partial [Myxococcales bacterium]|nr:hypothetical protein [Myxococcales bacterium]
RVDGSLLYIGKAKRLRTRVRSYFQRRRRVPDRLLEMLTQARALDVEQTETAVEAALLEHDQIKRDRPPYNVAMAGDGGLFWATADFSSLAEQPDARHVVGPVIGARVLAGLEDLAAWIAASGPIAGAERACGAGALTTTTAAAARTAGAGAGA